MSEQQVAARHAEQEFFCPHCLFAVATSSRSAFPPDAIRCEHCRLVIGAHRCKTRGEAAIERGTSGTAAGIMANTARRAAAAPGDPSEVIDALLLVAEMHDTAVDRLRMQDFDAAQRRGLCDIELAVVLSTFSSWKAARREAAIAAPPRERRRGRQALPPEEAA